MPIDPTNINEQPQPTPTPEQPDYSKNALHQKAAGDWNKAEQSYFSIVNQTKALNEQLAARDLDLQKATQALQALMGGAQQTQQSALSELASLGISTEALERELDARAEKKVESKLAEMFGPVVRQMEAEQTLADEIDDFDVHKASARKFMKDNAEVAEIFNKVKQMDPAAAWKYAIRETLIAQQATPARTLPPGLPGGRQPVGRGAPSSEGLAADQQTRELEAARYLQQTGDSAAYRHERFKGTSISRAVDEIRQQLGITPNEGW